MRLVTEISCSHSILHLQTHASATGMPINTAMITGGAGTHLQTHAACALFTYTCLTASASELHTRDAQLYLSDEGEEDETRHGPSKCVEAGAGTYQTKFKVETKQFIQEVKNYPLCTICNRQVGCDHMGKTDVEWSL